LSHGGLADFAGNDAQTSNQNQALTRQNSHEPGALEKTHLG
jgi:hypothetical protein